MLFDIKTGSYNRKIVLFMDHCPAHPTIKLINNELVFLPANTKSMLQPLDQGVFQLKKTSLSIHACEIFVEIAGN
jgi:hypothetical protein